MKLRYLLISFSLLFFAADVDAQLGLGIKGGSNISNIKEFGPSKSFDWNILTSFYIGAFADYALSDRLSVRAEGIYSFEGGEFEDAGGIRKVEINYINLPILLRLDLIHGIFLDAGIEPGIVLEKDDFYVDKDTEFGVLFGGGFQLGDRWSFNLRYVQGISSIYDINNTDVNGDPIGETNGKTRLWQVGAEFAIFR